MTTTSEVFPREDRIQKSFRHLDVDGNGYIEYDDVIALASRIMSAFGETPAEPKGRALLDGFETWWQALLASLDLDGDRRISPQEYLQGIPEAFADRHRFDKAFRPVASAVFRMVDTDDDGGITPDEWGRLQRAFRSSEQDAELSFRHLDTDRNGYLDVDELVEVARQYYTGTDDSAAANWLWGRVQPS
ncbi:EF-hand domain-containing protein [Streptomyces sp. NPDC058486]|uniref:EF-hand domain-containing protein n=1 Tax=unclassified Streptomyces TaxID=2593676 RepID=UPI0036576A82